MVRIRYKNTDGILTSKESFASSNGPVITQIFRGEDSLFRVLLLNATTGVTEFSHTTRNLAVAKRVAKECLKQLGVVFEPEVRNRGVTTSVSTPDFEQ
ncbi:hypothetical protein EB077_11200, partial [bacterium]|nr:hypothetical protein [bacterium]